MQGFIRIQTIKKKNADHPRLAGVLSNNLYFFFQIISIILFFFDQKKIADHPRLAGVLFAVCPPAEEANARRALAAGFFFFFLFCAYVFFALYL